MVPDEVLAAFAITGTPEPLDGGQGTSVAVDGLVLKPRADEAEIAWLAGVCARISAVGFRLPAPVPAADGRYVVSGWSVMTYAPGHPVPDDERSAEAWLPVLQAGRAFHQAVRQEHRPAFLDDRRHKWAAADQAAWRLPTTVTGRVAAMLARLSTVTVDERLPRQLIHGDLSGNVLLADGLAPAIIDVSPYWRPAAFADAVIVVDALLWWRAPDDLLDLAQPTDIDRRTWCSLLARALAFRRLAFDETSVPPNAAARELERYDTLADLVTGS